MLLNELCLSKKSMIKSRKDLIIAIKIVASLLNSKQINYVVGGSCSLLIHGVNVEPNDIDIVIDPADLIKCKIILFQYVVGNKFIINNIEGEIVSLPIDRLQTVDVLIDEIFVKVKKLELEYKYYKQKVKKLKKYITRLS